MKLLLALVFSLSAVTAFVIELRTVVPSTSTQAIIPDSDQDWCIFEDSFLYGYSSGVYTFGSFSEAQEQCALRSDCGGITQEPYNNDRFTLRRGPALHIGRSPTGETSWVSCDIDTSLVNELEDWCMFEDSFLYGYSSGTYSFETLSEALEECVVRSDCGGVTQEPNNNNRFTLRRGPVLQNRQSLSGETSWISCTEETHPVEGLDQDWCTFEDSFLYGYSSGVYTYGDLSEAQEQCAVRSDCGGVTKEPYNNERYTLRKGPEIHNGQSPTGETSWVACSGSEPSSPEDREEEFWCRFKDSFLYQYSSGLYTFDKFESAAEECILRSDCGGVTQEPYNSDRFTLRVGPALHNGVSPSGETSWVPCENMNLVGLHLWCTFEDSFLYSYSSGVYAYDRLFEAQKECASRSDCGGVTQEPYRKNGFTLRQGPALQNGRSPSGETAWVICD